MTAAHPPVAGAAAGYGADRHLDAGIGIGYSVGFADLQLRDADHHALIILFHVAGEQRVSAAVRHGDRPGAAAQVHHKGHLGGGIAEGLRHAGCARRKDGAAVDGPDAVIIQRAVAAVCGAGHHHRAAVHRQVAVGIDAVAVCVDVQRAAVDRDAGAVRGEHIVAAKAAAVVAAGGIDAVVAGAKGDIAAVDRDGRRLQAFVAFGNMDGTAVDGQGVVGVHAVVAGPDGEIAAVDRQIAVCMEGVVRSVDSEIAIQDNQPIAGLDALGAGGGILRSRIVILIPAAPAKAPHHIVRMGFAVDRAAVDGQIKAAARDEHIALTFFFILGANGVLAGRDGKTAVVNAHAVVGVQAPALRRDGIGAAGDLEVVLAHDAVIGGNDGQSACAVEGEILLGEDRPVDLGVFVKGRGGQEVIRALRQGDEHLVGLLHIDGRAGFGGDADTIQHQLHLGLVIRADSNRAVHRAGKQIDALLGNLNGRLAVQIYGLRVAPRAGKIAVGKVIG